MGDADLDLGGHCGLSYGQKGSLVRVIMEVERWDWGTQHLEMMVDLVQNQ